MLVSIIVYISSIAGYWLFIHYYRKESNASDVAILFTPLVNTGMLLIAVIYMLCEVNWYKVSNKLFKVSR